MEEAAMPNRREVIVGIPAALASEFMGEFKTKELEPSQDTVLVVKYQNGILTREQRSLIVGAVQRMFENAGQQSPVILVADDQFDFETLVVPQKALTQHKE
jgi:hypothetical protein